jgi:MoxR-like ATPase
MLLLSLCLIDEIEPITPKVIGVLLGSQQGREIEITNSFEVPFADEDKLEIDHGFFVARREQCE